MTAATASASTKNPGWGLPAAVLGLVLLFAWQFVHDDTTANLIELALALGALGVIGWGHWLTERKLKDRTQLLRDRILLALGVGGALAYSNFGHLHFGNFIHVWDTYHYYMGAKYFPEVGYERLYDCAAIADSESGLRDQASKRSITDLRTNILVPGEKILEHPEVCKDHFSPERWESFKRDLSFFRSRVNPIRWKEIHQDHGYNATPVWTLAGWALTNTGAASLSQVVALNLIDPLYLALMGLLIYWAFGPRVFALGMLVLGTNFPSRYYWTGGAFLRHDWLFFTVAVVCLLKKDRPFLAGAALAYATLLRLFPGLLLLGPLLAGVEYLRVHRKFDPRFLRFIAGGAAATALLLSLSFALTEGPKTWVQFAANTEKHARTPLTNHMGLRTVLSFRPATTGYWMVDESLLDQWSRWKDTRVEKYNQAKPLFYASLLGLLVLLYFAVRHTQAELWVSAALGTGMIVAGAELTCYYYCFLIGMAALHEKRREVGMLLMALTAVTQLINLRPIPTMSGWLDEQYVAMSIASLVAVVAIWYCFTRRGAQSCVEPEPAPVPHLGLNLALATAPSTGLRAGPAAQNARGSKRR